MSEKYVLYLVCTIILPIYSKLFMKQADPSFLQKMVLGISLL